MLSFVPKIFQSIIARDQLVKLFSQRNGVDHRIHPAVMGYGDFENQMGALQDSRAYRKIALKAESKSNGSQLPEQFFYRNYATRDLVEIPALEVDQQSPFAISLLIEVLLKTSLKVLIEQPPPLKSSLIPDVNLIARLLPVPTATSA